MGTETLKADLPSGRNFGLAPSKISAAEFFASLQKHGRKEAEQLLLCFFLKSLLVSNVIKLVQK
jgi:hypothetical protein